MLAEVRTNVTLALVKPEAVDPTNARVITQDAFLKLPSGKIVKVFEGAEEEFFKPIDVGAAFSVVFYLDTGDRNIGLLDTQRRSIAQSDVIAVVEGCIVRVDPYVYQKYQVYVDAGDCIVRLYTNRELNVGSYIRAEGRLEVRDKRRVRDRNAREPDS